MPVSINKDLKPIIFVHVQKVGGHSIRNSLEKAGYRWAKNVNKHEKPINIPHIGEYFSFAFVRNPFDVCVSRFLYHHREDKKNETDMLYQRFPNNKEGFNLWINSLKTDNIWHNTSKFGSLWPYASVKPQKEFLSNEDDSICVDFIGKFENFNDDFQKICDIIGCMNYLEDFHLNKSIRQKNYKEYYDNSSVETIKSLYKKDLEYFNYEF